MCAGDKVGDDLKNAEEQQFIIKGIAEPYFSFNSKNMGDFDVFEIKSTPFIPYLPRRNLDHRRPWSPWFLMVSDHGQPWSVTMVNHGL